MLKPGYRTSEFWFTLVSFLFSGLYLVGLLDSNDHKEALIQETTRGVEAVILIIGQLTVLFRYIKGRTELKKVWWNTEAEHKLTENKKANQTNKPKKTRRKNNGKSTISKRSNKSSKPS